ncbi:unnamed protein product [Symbiodinium sp. CCMP2456]|nr:unnamed protein product [Symbiodinium sp. CCMP2456]
MQRQAFGHAALDRLAGWRGREVASRRSVSRAHRGHWTSNIQERRRQGPCSEFNLASSRLSLRQKLPGREHLHDDALAQQCQPARARELRFGPLAGAFSAQPPLHQVHALLQGCLLLLAVMRSISLQILGFEPGEKIRDRRKF